MFDGFSLEMVDLDEIQARVRIGGDGPPILLLHGAKQTHVMWHRVAPALAERFTVVAPDLRGYGRSSKPPATPDHARYSKRVMARDQVQLMTQLGHERFGVAGHDRGGRVAYRLALDHPEVIDRLAVLDIIPTGEAFARGGREFGLGFYHWFFLAQPAPFPEKLIGADPEWFWRWPNSVETTPAYLAAEAVDDYLDCFRDPETIRGLCEDYRAGATIDFELDQADRRAGRKIGCPLLVLWAARGEVDDWYDPLEVWRGWADDVRGEAIPSGHHMAEEAPEETTKALLSFFAEVVPR
jgi:haloacetate dehalogenase